MNINAVKWACLYLQALCALLAIAFVHCDDRLASLLATGLFATGVSASVLLIAAHDRPFVGEVAVTPKPLLQIVSDPSTIALSGSSRISPLRRTPSSSALPLPVAGALARKLM